MRRLMLVLALVLALVPLTAATSQALVISGYVSCNTNPCVGGDEHDIIWERPVHYLDDKIYALGGNDWVSAKIYTDDHDAVFAGRGDDVILTNDGDGKDAIYAGYGGHDTCIVDLWYLEKHIEGCETIIHR